MTIDNFVLNRKYLYVNTELGCDMVGTGGEIYHIPAGYWCFLVEEVLEFFSVSYVSFVCNDFDTSFKAETRDFFVQNLQTPFDLNVSSFVQTIGSINSSLISITDFCRILQNSTSMILSALLVSNPIQNVGALNLVKSSKGSNIYEAYLPNISTNFGGVLLLTLEDVSNFYLDYNLEHMSGKPYRKDLLPYIECDFSYKENLTDFNYALHFLNDVERFISLKLYNTDGVEYKNVVFAEPFVKSVFLKGGVYVNYVHGEWPLGNNGFIEIKNLTSDNFLVASSRFGGISLTGSGGSVNYHFDSYSDVNRSGATRDISIKSVIEIPFSVVVSPDTKDVK